jgi:hypothetical protein
MTGRPQPRQRPAEWVLPDDPAERQAAFWRMSPAERVATMRRGRAHPQRMPEVGRTRA